MEPEQLWLELCLDAGLSYGEYMKQPDWIIETHYLRYLAKGSTVKKT